MHILFKYHSQVKNNMTYFMLYLMNLIDLCKKKNAFILNLKAATTSKKAQQNTLGDVLHHTVQ